MKKGLIATIAVVIAIVAAAAAMVHVIGGEPLPRTVSLKGYEISVPEDWTASADGTLTDKQGNVAGKYVLINEEPDLGNVTAYAGAALTGAAVQEDFAENSTKSLFETEDGKAVQYFIGGLPNPEPYAASITLYLSYVSKKTADNIAKSFRLPVMGEKPPAKNLRAPSYDEIGKDKTAKLTENDGTVQVKNISLIDSFIKLQSEGHATGLDILSYKKNENGDLLIDSWSHIENSSNRGYMYVYYDRGDGLYTYDNNPVIFQSITKEVVTDKGITAYRLKIGEAETASLLEIPIDLYRDNAESLLSLQTAESSNESVMKILEQIMPEEERAGVTATKTDKGVTLKFDADSTIDTKGISKDAAVIFTLSPDIHSVTAEGADGETYVLERDELMSEVATAADTATRSPEEFARFAEELENLEEAVPEGGSADGAASGTVIYSDTVVISASTMVTHPRTGERVAVGPYAEARGYGGYLGKPISVTIKKQGDGYVASASCSGRVIASQTYKTESAARSAIAMARAFS